MNEELHDIVRKFSEDITVLYLQKITEIDPKLLESNIFSITGICCSVFVMTAMNFLIEVLDLKENDAQEMRDTFLSLLDGIYDKYYRGTL